MQSRIWCLIAVLGTSLVLLPGCRDDLEPPTGPALESDQAQLAQAPVFRQVVAGTRHSCGVTFDSRAYCWGSNSFGQLGDGVGLDHLTPHAVAGTHRFLTLDAGSFHTCGVTTDERIYCWGWNAFGQLGNGALTSDDPNPVPTAVAGDRRFRQVRGGDQHTCGLTVANVLFCWGENHSGALGNGTTTTRNPRPLKVSGGLTFRQVSAGFYHTCGITPADRVYCWGLNVNGQLGDGTTTQRLVPRAVAGGLLFRQVNAGAQHTCAVTGESRAYCWGRNVEGQLGDGTRIERHAPRAVAGTLRLRTVSVGTNFTCGVTLGDRARCWGLNSSGQLGNGTTTGRITPVAVAGALPIHGLWTGDRHACGLTTDDRAYCWGGNDYGQLGDGTQTMRTRPVAVAAIE